MAYKTFAEESVDYHRSKGKLDTNGKIGVKITKSSNSLEDLCMAYIPGVAYPCQEIEQDSEKVYKYTNKANSVAIITNGTSVLGFGDIGHLASKPVMEGKAQKDNGRVPSWGGEDKARSGYRLLGSFWERSRTTLPLRGQKPG